MATHYVEEDSNQIFSLNTGTEQFFQEKKNRSKPVMFRSKGDTKAILFMVNANEGLSIVVRRSRRV